MYSMRRFFLLAFSLMIFFPTGIAMAMASSNYAIPSDSLNGGGGDTSSSTNFKIRDTVGQTATGPAASGSFAAEQGYRTKEQSSTLSASFVDAGGTVIASPVAAFAAITVGTTTANGTLATASSKIRVTNTRTVATWSLTIAATAGPTATWLAGATSLDFNDPVTNALTIDPSAATITPVGMLCTTTDLASGASAAFDQGVIDSITMLTAGGSAMTGCSWDMTGITLSQTIPAAQAAGSYSISMTITVA
jgi:hypothetical protein